MKRGYEHFLENPPALAARFIKSSPQAGKFSHGCGDIHVAAVPRLWAPLERSHAELSGALMLAGRHIRNLSFAKRNDPVLARLRQVLRGERDVSRGVYRVLVGIRLPDQRAFLVPDPQGSAVRAVKSAVCA